MLFDYDSFFNWDRPAYTFSRSVHDMSPYKIKTLEDRVVLVHNIVGVKEDDIKVDIVTEDGSDEVSGEESDMKFIKKLIKKEEKAKIRYPKD